VYWIEELAKENGHTVLHLPPYHCELIAIEVIWASVKRQVLTRSSKQNKWNSEAKKVLLM
jgi:transposase